MKQEILKEPVTTLFQEILYKLAEKNRRVKKYPFPDA
jgi:hypothetical protein